MDDTVRKISADDINPRYNWGRALPALGTMGVDFEERVDYRRLHRYRLARVREALEKSDLGALLVFDVNNIRYVTSTKIGEWERDKLCRWALLTRDGDPILARFTAIIGGVELPSCGLVYFRNNHKLRWFPPQIMGRSGLIRISDHADYLQVLDMAVRAFEGLGGELPAEAKREPHYIPRERAAMPKMLNTSARGAWGGLDV